MSMSTNRPSNTPTPPQLSSLAEQAEPSGRADRTDRWDDALVSRQRQRYLASLLTAEAHPADSRSPEP